MPRLLFATASVVSGALLMVNCTVTSTAGGTSSDGSVLPKADGGTNPVVTDAKSLVAAYFEAYGKQAARCQGGPIDAFLEEVAKDPSNADKLGSKGVNTQYFRLVQDCIAALATAPCGGVPAACDAVENSLGTLATNTACLYDEQCASRSCAATAINTCGKCADATLDAGADCRGSKDSLCKPGLLCVSTGATSTCATKTVVAEGGVCATEAQHCASGLVCVTPESGNPTCRKFIARGGICANASGVISECDQGGTYTCSPTSNTCVPRPKLGEACSTDFRCEFSVLCDGDSSKCRAAKYDVAVGVVCEFGDRCIAGARCAGLDVTTGKQVCATDLALGADCSPGKGVCGDDMICNASKKCEGIVLAASCK